MKRVFELVLAGVIAAPVLVAVGAYAQQSQKPKPQTQDQMQHYQPKTRMQAQHQTTTQAQDQTRTQMQAPDRTTAQMLAQEQREAHGAPPKDIKVISPEHVAGALKQSGIRLPSERRGGMLEVPVNRHNVIGAKPEPFKNPYANDPNALVMGRKLYVSMNCAVCHGIRGGGGQGEQLNTGDYRYGGEPADIYLSISHGRPLGMPSWGSALPPQAIWYLVTYVKTLPKLNPNHPHKTPATLQRQELQAPIIRTFALPGTPPQGPKKPAPASTSSKPGAQP